MAFVQGVVVCSVLFFDFLNNVLWVLCFSQHVIGAGFNFGRVGEFSFLEELCMIADLRELVRVESCQKGLGLVFGDAFVTFPEGAQVIFEVSRHFMIKRWKC